MERYYPYAGFLGNEVRRVRRDLHQILSLFYEDFYAVIGDLFAHLRVNDEEIGVGDCVDALILFRVGSPFNCKGQQEGVPRADLLHKVVGQGNKDYVADGGYLHDRRAGNREVKKGRVYIPVLQRRYRLRLGQLLFLDILVHIPAGRRP